MADSISDIQRDKFMKDNNLTPEEYQKMEEDNSKEALCLNCGNPIVGKRFRDYRKTQFCSAWCLEIYEHYVEKGRRGDT